VALERTSELLKAASSNVLRFKLDGDLPLEFRDRARVTGRIVQLPAHDAHQIEQYLAIIRQAGLRVEDVEIRKADLEDVFLDVMTGRAGVTPLPRAAAAEPGVGRTADDRQEAELT
jgi:ABC-2 type transport system ATP-binding protein